MNRKNGGQASLNDRRGVVSASRRREDSENEEMEESGLSEDEDEQVGKKLIGSVKYIKIEMKLR